MVYEWDDKEAECYNLYVEERKSLDEVMQHMKEVHNFNPSKRAFQTQFKRWDFPSKQNPAHKQPLLVERVHQLWEANTSQKDMLRILNAEGHNIKERELMRVRTKHRWLLRVPNGTKTFGSLSSSNDLKGVKRKRNDGSDATRGEQHLDEADTTQAPEELVGLMAGAALEAMLSKKQGEEGLQHQQPDDGGDANAAASPKSDEPRPALSPEVLEKRKVRLEKLAAESDERWANKTRRRRTRGWAGLPADPPGPPRFPSETTIDESKAFLHLSNDLYRQLRDQFQGICEDAGFLKKTAAGPEKWQAAKDRLVSENPHLQNEFYGPPNEVQPESKALALDVVCTDVTKRMRTLERRMTIAEAKNSLHINPEQSREIRNQFYEVLKADHFTSKLEAGDEHWVQLKQRWIEGSELLQQILAGGASDPDYEGKVKAIEVLCRDVMKRLRDDQTKRDPSRKKQINAGPGPGPAPPKITRALPSFPPYAPTASMVPASAGIKHAQAAAAAQDELQIDPSLLAAASDPSLDITLQLQQFAAEAAGRQEYDAPPPQHPHASSVQGQPHGSSAAAVAAAAAYHSIPIYVRLHPASPLQQDPKVWVGVLAVPAGASAGASSALAQLISITQTQHPGTGVMKLWGVVIDAATRQETMYPIEREEDLAVYLQFVGDGGKAGFSVQLAEQ